MHALVAALALFAFADDEPTYTVTVDVSGVWGKSWIETIEKSLGRLEGVKSAKMGDTKTVYVLQVMENKTVLPSQIEKALEPDGYQYEGMKVDLCGTVEEKEGAYTFTARGSKQKYTLQPNDDLKKLVKEGKTKLALSGKVTEPEEKDGKKPLPVIEVSSAKEDKK